MKPVSDPIVVAPPELSPERRLLWDSAARMEKDGWMPNASGCALMTIDRVAHDIGFSGKLYWDAVDILKTHIGVLLAWDVAEWSDASDGPTVIQALRDAAVS